MQVGSNLLFDGYEHGLSGDYEICSKNPKWPKRPESTYGDQGSCH
jgi:hypothetical protein